jgi:hypothetical protein
MTEENAKFYCYWNETTRMSYLESWKFYWRNETGTWIEKYSGSFSVNTYEAWTNVTLTLPAGEYRVEWYIWVQTTSGLTNQTSVQTFWCYKKLPNVLERVLGDSFGGSKHNGAIFYNATATGGTAAIYIVFSNSSTSPWTYQVAAFDLNSEKWTDEYSIGNIDGDDTHWNPVISILPDGRLIVLYDYVGVQYRISTYNASIETNLTKLVSNWESSIYTIPQLCYPDPFRWDDRFVLLGRNGTSDGGDWIQYVWNGTAFVNGTIITYFNVPDTSTSLYAYGTKEGNNILLGFTRREYGGNNSGIYFLYSDDRGITWRLINGTSKTLPIDGQDCLVVESEHPTQAGAPFLDENNTVVIPAVHDYNIWLAQYSSGLGTTGTWTYEQIKFENGTLINTSFGDLNLSNGLVFMNDPYYGRPSGWTSIDNVQNKLCKIVRAGGTTHKFEVVWIDNDYTDVQIPSIHYLTNVVDAPEAYELLSREQHIGVLSNLTIGTEQFRVYDTYIYGVKLVAEKSGRLMGVRIYFNQTNAGLIYFQAALYNETKYKLALGTRVDHSYGARDIVTWSVPSTLDYYITEGTTYWLVFRLEAPSPYIFQESGGQSNFFSLYSTTFPDQITGETLYAKFTTIQGFFSKIVIRGIGRKFPTQLNVGWTNFQVWNVDVGYTLSDVNGSLNLDNINWTAIVLEYQNGTRVSLVWEQDTGEYIGFETAVIESINDEFWIYCLEAGEWNHNYE